MHCKNYAQQKTVRRAAKLMLNPRSKRGIQRQSNKGGRGRGADLHGEVVSVRCGAASQISHPRSQEGFGMALGVKGAQFYRAFISTLAHQESHSGKLFSEGMGN